MNNFSSFGILLRKDDTPTPTNTFIDDNLPTPHLAAAKGDIALLTTTIQQDARCLGERSQDGLTPLAQAVQCQQLKSVKRLISMGADINAQDNIGRTCLSVAAYQGWHEGVVCLLHSGAKRNIADNSGRSPIHAATYHSDTNTLSILLNSLSIQEINQPDNEMMTAVHWAAFHDRPDHLMQLIQKKADIFARDIDGKLPLHWAAQNGSFQCVHRLTSLSEGLSTVNDLDLSGKSPAHYAAAAGAANILTILSHCDNINLEIEDPDERTPLHWAAAMGHDKAVETLMKIGVNPHVTDVDGYTPLDYAKQSEFPDCLKVMEACLGKRSGRMSFGKTPVSGKSDAVEEKYRYRKVTTPHSQLDLTVPDINVMPPTVTQTMTKTTTNKTGALASTANEPPRMYSASTDTDVLEFSPHQNVQNATNKTNNHHRHQPHQQHHQTKPNEDKEQKIFSISDHSNVFSKLINSSFTTGAQGPILSQESWRDQNNPTTQRKLSDLKEPKDEGDTWAQHSGNNRPVSTREKGLLELKMMTSQNTPDLNRVSVNSFRSIPPIPNPGNDTPRGTSQTRRDNGYPSTGTNRNDLELPPVSNGDGTLRKGVASPSKQATIIQPPPHDFMTDNNAETRILNRMLRSTLGKVDHKPPPYHHPLQSAEDKERIRRTPGQQSIANIIREKRKDDRAILQLKHSRIPSTRLITSNNTQHNQSLTAANVNGINRSPSGVFLCNREKYLDEDISKPISPTPLLSIALPGSGKGKPDKQHELPNVHKTKSKSKNASKSRHTLEKLSNRYGRDGAAGGGGGGSVHVPGRKDATISEETPIRMPLIHTPINMPPIQKEDVQKTVRRVRNGNRKLQLSLF